MLDEIERLLECEELQQLLIYYRDLGQENRESWHDRLTEHCGIHGRELTRLFGELLAHGWLEQNTGDTPILELGRFACCYRIAGAGLKALKEVRLRKAELVLQ
jgi:hypothetical protein